jgi:ABC-type transporter Mla MlaB component
MEPIKRPADGGILRVMITGHFDMSLVFDLWQTCQLEQDRYHTYLFDLARVGELRDSGLAWLTMFHRRATRAGAGVRLINCRPEMAERCVSVGLEMGSVAPHLSIHAATAHTVYLAHEPMRGCVHKTRLKELMDHYNTHAPLSKSLFKIFPREFQRSDIIQGISATYTHLVCVKNTRATLLESNFKKYDRFLKKQEKRQSREHWTSTMYFAECCMY